jgi:hypothetical protein
MARRHSLALAARRRRAHAHARPGRSLRWLATRVRRGWHLLALACSPDWRRFAPAYGLTAHSEKPGQTRCTPLWALCDRCVRGMAGERARPASVADSLAAGGVLTVSTRVKDYRQEAWT